MLSPLFLCTLAAVSAAAIVLYRRKGSPLPCFLFATLVIPFAAGGFHGYAITAATVVLSVFLFLRIRKQGYLSLYGNLESAAVASLLLFSLLTPLWAADRGMAPFGILRWTAVVLYGLYLMQCSDAEKSRALDPVPLTGALMTVLSLILLPIPGLKEQLAVNGRLAGFFQYPNTYAAFLLAGIILQNRENRWYFPLRAVLMTGIVLSGSRTVFLLLAAALGGLLLIRRNLKAFLADGLCLLAAVAVGQLFSSLGFLEQADRYTEITPQAGTFLVRLLYDKDALKLIAAHPFGLGYLGYRAMEGSIQTGRYYVTYVHNGLFQLLLDLGWLPGFLMTAAFLKNLLSRRIPAHHRLLLALLLAHCLLDYDTEFLSVWILLLSLTALSSGKSFRVQARPLLLVPAGLLLGLNLWLGAADGCYYSGHVEACLKLTPFHTEAQVYRLSRQEDPLILDPLADDILACNPRQPLALTAKAGAAFYRGDARAMMGYMEKAIACDRYNVDLYCDYIQKLYTAAQAYQKSGNTGSMTACIRKILEIPETLAAVEATTDPLAWKTGDDPSMTLPEPYPEVIESLKPYA